jgi:hypothetical protein
VPLEATAAVDLNTAFETGGRKSSQLIRPSTRLRICVVANLCSPWLLKLKDSSRHRAHAASCQGLLLLTLTSGLYPPNSGPYRPNTFMWRLSQSTAVQITLSVYFFSALTSERIGTLPRLCEHGGSARGALRSPSAGWGGWPWGSRNVDGRAAETVVDRLRQSDRPRSRPGPKDAAAANGGLGG